MAKRATSVAKVEANRTNARKSTGPRTAKGKSVSRWNATKHGILSEAVVIDAGDGCEDRKEFDAVLAALRRGCHPEGILEEMLVERIAVCYWRLRRVLRCEVGEEVRRSWRRGQSLRHKLTRTGVSHRCAERSAGEGR